MRVKPRNLSFAVPRQLLAVLVVVLLFCATFAGVWLAGKNVGAATLNTINFQARLMNTSGSVVNDGFYNIEFKLYNVSSGGSALWTETYYDSNGGTAGNDNRLRVENGYLTVALNSLNDSWGAINWDQGLWLTMNVGGSSQTATPTWDGEMDPRLKLTAVPYAFRAGQLAQFNSGNSFTSTLSIVQPTGGNQTFQIPDQGAAGTYNLLTAPSGSDGYVKLQGSSPGSPQTGHFNINGTGIAGTALQAPLFQTADGTGASTALTLRTGNATSSGNTGNLTIATGNSAAANSGNISIDVGTASSGTAGTISIGTAQTSGITIGRTGITTTHAGHLSISANQNLSLANGTGVLSQTFTSSAASSAQTLSVTNSNSGGSSVAINGQQITLVGTATSGGTNSNTAISFANPSAATNNNFYGLNFAGTGYTDILRVNGTQIINGSGVLQNAGLSSSITYSNLTKVGALDTGSIASGFGTISTGNNISTTAAIQGGTGTFTGANALTLGTTGTSTGAIVFNGSTGGSGTLTLVGPASPNASNYILSIPAITNNANICTDNSICSGYQAAGSYESPLTFENGLTRTTNTVTLGGALNQATTLSAGNSQSLSVTSSLAGGARAANLVTISQADDATNNMSGNLLRVDQLDAASGASAVYIDNNSTVAGGYALTVDTANANASGAAIRVIGAAGSRGIDVTSITSGTGIVLSVTTGTGTNANAVTTGTAFSATGVTTGIGLNVTATTTGRGLVYNTTANGLTTGSAVSITGSASGITADYTGALINVTPTRTLTAAATRTDSGQFLNLVRSNTVNNAGATYNVTGALANLQSNCTQTAGTCADSANILNLNQQYANASGAVLNIQGAGTGNLATLDATNASANGISVDLQSSSTSQFALNLTSNNGSTNILSARANGNVGLGTTGPDSKLHVIGGICVESSDSGCAAAAGTAIIQGDNALTLGLTGTNTGEIIFRGSTAASGTITLTGAANPSTNNYTLTIPTLTANAHICTDNSVCTGYQAAGDFFAQGGNDFNATAVLGTNDADDLQLETNNIVRATFDQSNGLYLGNGVTAASPNNFTVAATGSATAGTAGADLTLQGGAGASATTGSMGGSVLIAGGNAGGSGNNAGGNVTLQGGLDTNTGTPGKVLVKNSADSATAFEVQNAAGTSTIFDVDTANGRVGVGTAAPLRTVDVSIDTTSVNSLPLLLQQAGTGDIGLEISTGAESYYLGIDNSDSDKFKISSGSSSGSVTVMGNNTTGTNTDSGHANALHASKFTASVSGTITKIFAYVASPVSGGPNNLGQVALYTNNGGVPDQLLASSTSTTLTGDAWNEFTIAPTSVNSSTDYWLAYNTNGGTSGHNNLRYTNPGGADQSVFDASETYGSWPTTWATVSGTPDVAYSIYAQITGGGGSNNFSVALFELSSSGQALFKNSSNSTTAFRVQNAAGTNLVSLDTASASAVLNLGVTGSDTQAGTVNIGTSSAAIQGVTIGSTSSTSTTTIQGGTGNANGDINIGDQTTAGKIIDIGSVTNAGTSTVRIATGAAAQTVTIGSTNSTSTLTLQAGTGTATGDINIGDQTTAGKIIHIGSVDNAGTGTVRIATGAAAQDVMIGSTNGTSTTRLQAGSNHLIIDTGGTVRATFDGAGNNVYFGNGVTAASPNDFAIRGTGSATTAVAGGALTIQGGNATVGTANGGNVVLAGGTGFGGGVKGLVVVDTATFSTASSQSSAVDVAVTQANIDSSGALVLNATAASVDFTLSDPTLGASAAGRLLYVIAANGSQDFTLRANVGEGVSIEQNIAMRQNTTATMIWTGSNWTAAGASSSTTLQAAYDNTLSSAGSAEIVLNNTTTGLTIRNNVTTPIIGGLLEVQTSIGTNLFSVNNNISELVANGGGEDSTNFATNWTSFGTATITRNTTAGQYATGVAGAQFASTTANSGIRNNLASNPATSTVYLISFAAKLESGSPAFTDMTVQYTPNGGTTTINCLTGQEVVSTDWRRFTCEVNTGGTSVTNPDILIFQVADPGAPTRTVYIDNLSMTLADDAGGIPNNVQIGGGIYGGAPTLFTLDRSSAPPVANGNQTYLGSMYYDTTSGRIQCYESDGWGACGSAPDNIITLTPEYTGAVLNGTGVGTMTADFCANQSTVLEINTSFCAAGISRNYYRWTSPQDSQQSYSIFVSYKLPSTFKEFADANTIRLTALTDSLTNGVVDYQVFRSTGSTISSCGSQTTVTTSANTWQTVSFGGDETVCGFVGGNYIIFKINVRAEDNANVYVENLDFTYLNT